MLHKIAPEHVAHDITTVYRQTRNKHMTYNFKKGQIQVHLTFYTFPWQHHTVNYRTSLLW